VDRSNVSVIEEGLKKYWCKNLKYQKCNGFCKEEHNQTYSMPTRYELHQDTAL
jgi:hypothetical protein